MTGHHLVSTGLWLAAGLIAAPAAAQESGSPASPAPTVPAPAASTPAVPSKARQYSYADLAKYAPKSALDMVQRIPGFSVNTQGNMGARGFGQAQENILLNGQRLSGKSNDTADALSRIDARQVVRIEILDGAALDVPGLSGEVANIVYAARKTSGRYSWSPTIRELGLDDNWSKGSVALTGGGLSSSWNASLDNESNRRGFVGPETIVDAGGAFVLVRDERSQSRVDQPRLAGSYSRTAANGNILNINGAAKLEWSRNRQDGDVRRADGTRFAELFTNAQDEWNVELGGDYQFALGPGRLKTIVLQRNEQGRYRSRFGQVGARTSGFNETIDENESVLRAEYGLRLFGGDAQFSLEGAYNRLADKSALVSVPVGGSASETPLPGIVIDEKRGEALASLSRSLGRTLSLQANAGAEISRIGFTRLASASRTFVRPKGSLALAWKARDWATVNLKADRIVDQLDFFQFLAAVDVQDSVERSSNADIVPQQRWKLRGEVVLRGGAWGTVTPYGEWFRIEDPLAYIPDGTGGEKIGNLDTIATQWDYGVNGTLLLDPAGMKGVRLDVHAHRPGSRLVDPLLGNRRAFDAQELWHVRIGARHDVPRTPLAYGVNWNGARIGPVYRLAQNSRTYTDGARIDLFVEHKDVAGLQVRVDLYNILENEQVYRRIAYRGTRAGPVSFIESYRKEGGKVLDLTVTGRF